MPFSFVLFIYKDGCCCAGEISASTSMHKFLIAIDETAYANAQYHIWCSIGNLELVGKTKAHIIPFFPLRLEFHVAPVGRWTRPLKSSRVQSLEHEAARFCMQT